MILALMLGCSEPATEPVDRAPSFETLIDTGAADVTGPELAPVDLVGRAVVCPNPEARDVQPYDVWESEHEQPRDARFASGGVLVADVNGDARLDLLIPGLLRSFLYLGVEGGFVDASVVLRGLPLAASSGVTAADYDADGDPDVLVTRFLLPDVLLRNEGTHFVDVTQEAGLTQALTRSIQSSWGDLDRDGDLDLFVGSYGYLDEGPGRHEDFLPADPSFLYLNDGDGTFSDVSDRLPDAVHDGYTLGGGFHDLDADGWLDLYVVNDFGVSTPNALLWNEQGALVADGNRSGLDIAITGMGLGVGDLNEDGLPDLFMPEWDGLHIYESGAAGVWVDWAGARGLANDLERDQKIAWGGELVDLDHDGDLDLPVSYGHLDSTYESERVQPDALYIQQADGTFRDEGEAWGLDHGGISRGSVVTDLNDDGWLDIVVRVLDGPTRVYLSRCGEQAWLRVRLEQGGLNPDAIGARVEVSAEQRTWWGVVRAGGTSFSSGGPPEVHFGLAELESVDLRIVWPDGEVSEQRGVQTRQVVDITRRDDDAPVGNDGR